jgi:hypothetical protein
MPRRWRFHQDSTPDWISCLAPFGLREAPGHDLPADSAAPILEAWRRLVATRTPVTLCRYAVSRELETRVLPAFSESEADFRLHARALTRPLVEQALAKLPHLHPDDATLGLQALIRAHPDQAYQVCAEAVAWVTARYVLDVLAHPDDRLAVRASRLYAVITTSSWASWSR